MTDMDDGRLTELLRAAAALPRQAEPPAEVWTGVRARIARPRPRRMAPTWLAAAAVVILLVGAGVVLPWLRGPVRNAKAVATAAPRPAVAAVAVERQYAPTLAELDATLQRDSLTPATVQVVDRSLADIDTAIAETRDALRADPSNAALVDILSSHYERKVDLLQWATELSASF